MQFWSPKYLTEAFDILDQAQSPVLIGAGLTHLLRFYPRLPDGVDSHYSGLLHIGEIAALSEVKEEHAKYSLGAGLKIFELESDMFLARYLPSVWEAARLTSTPQIRNSRTLGGEMAWASFHSPLVTALMSFDAQVKIRRVKDKEGRIAEDSLSLFDFYQDSLERRNEHGHVNHCRKTALRDNDLILKICINEEDYRRNGSFSFLKCLAPKISTENPGVVVAVRGQAQNGTLVWAKLVASGPWMNTLSADIPLEGTKLRPNVFFEKLYQWSDRYPYEQYRRGGPNGKQLGLMVFGLLKEGFSSMLGS